MRYPYLPESRINAAASRLLHVSLGESARAHRIDLDALIFEHLCEREDLVFSDERELGYLDGEPILGKMRPYQNEILICASVRREGPEGRYRFTVAHEIGHWVLHRPLFLAIREQSDLFSGGAQEKDALVSLNRNVFPGRSGTDRVPPEEWQANRFAVALLVNAGLLQEAFAQRFGNAPIPLHDAAGRPRAPTIRALSRQIASERAAGLSPLQDLFGLSNEAMAIALEARGYTVESPPLL